MLAPLWAPLCQPRKRRRVGGWRQRAARGEDDEEETFSMSSLAAGHLSSWCDGIQSAAALRRHMADAVSDGFKHPMVTRFGNLGGGGGRPSGQHCHESLVRLLQACGVNRCLTSLPSPSDVSHIILPSTIIKVAAQDYPTLFKKYFGANARKVEMFWRGFFESGFNREWAAAHPCLHGKSLEQLRNSIPITIHEDAGPISKNLSANCISFSSLLGEGDEKVTKFLSFTYVKGRKTINTRIAWDAFLEDLHHVSTGFVGGAPVAPIDNDSRWTFIAMFAKGDEECHANSWGMPHWQGAGEPCSECRANRGARPWTDLNRRAAWRDHVIQDKAAYVARIRVPAHPLVESFFFSRWCAFPDLMHMMDCKGVSASVLGGVLQQLIVDVRLGGSQEARLDRINALLVTWYNDHPGSNRLPTLFISNLTRDGWWELNGPAIKAAMTRSAVPPFRDIWREHAQAGNANDAHVTAIIENLALFYDVLYQAPMFMPRATIDRIEEICMNFGIAYLHCREYARSHNILSWPVRMKTHKMQHVPLMCKVINPVHVQCYGEESLIGTTTKVWKRSIAGRHHNVAQRNVLLKRFCGLLLRFEGYA